MNREQSNLPVLDSMYLDVQEEAQEILFYIEDNANEVVKDLKTFRRKLQKLDTMRAEMGMLPE